MSKKKPSYLLNTECVRKSLVRRNFVFKILQSGSDPSESAIVNWKKNQELISVSVFKYWIIYMCIEMLH